MKRLQAQDFRGFCENGLLGHLYISDICHVTTKPNLIMRTLYC
jgi:hypothetical protein